MGDDGETDLEDCLESFFQVEEMRGDNKWQCDKCKVKRQATKSIYIGKLPNTLIVHLKKFKHDRTSRRKINGTFDFPISRMKIDEDYLAKGLLMDSDPTYSLKSIICHIGT